MKKLLLTVVGAGLLLTNSVCGQGAIHSNVIHDYTQVGVGYGLLYDIDNTDINAHGALAAASYEMNNIVLGVSGGYYWVDEPDLPGVDTDINYWTVGATLGYVVRMQQNRINLIPRIGVSYAEIDAEVSGFGSGSEGTTLIHPGVTLSYAITDRVSINGGYTYTRDIDQTDDESHTLSAGGVLALTEQIGLAVNADFIEERGFSGLTAFITYHF